MDVDSVRDVVFHGWANIQESGESFEQSVSGQSIFQGAFKEKLNWTATVMLPSMRVIDSEHFNIGLAVARFVYLIRAKRTIEEIAFYAPGVMNFSDDGKHLFGSSYGYQLFHKNQFWNVAETLRTTTNSKRIYVPIFTEEDLLRDSKDIPCAIGLLFTPRGNRLHATLLMRANDAYRLLPYNLFEFSLLHECMSVASGMQTGAFSYYAGTLHLRGDDVTVKENPWEHAGVFSMQPVSEFNKKLRSALLKTELLLRTRIPVINEKDYSPFVTDAVGPFDPFWKQILLILADYGYSKYHKKKPPHIAAALPLYELYYSK